MGLTRKQKRSKGVREARRVLRIALAAGHFDGMTAAQAEEAALEILAGRYAVLVQARTEPAFGTQRVRGKFGEMVQMVRFTETTLKVTDVPSGLPSSAIAHHNLKGATNGNQT